MKVLIDDVGLLVSGGVLLVLCVRWFVGLWSSRKCQQQQQQQQQHHRPIQATTRLPPATQQTEKKKRDHDDDGKASRSLTEFLLEPTHLPFSQQRHFYLMRNRSLAWSREVCGLLLFAVYLARASTLLYGGKDATGGVRLLLVAGGWLVLSRLEETPGLGGQGYISTCGSTGNDRRRGTSTDRTSLPRSPAWLTLWLGYTFYAAFAVHPFVVAADEPGGLDVAKEVAGVQLCLAILLLVLLGAEAVIALVETRRDTFQTGHPRSRSSQEDFLYSSLSPSSTAAGTNADQRAESDSHDGGEAGSFEGSHDAPVDKKKTKTISGFHLFTKLAFPPSPEQKASLLSTLLFSWIGPVLATGKRKVLALEDLNELEQEDRSVYIWRAFRSHLRAVETRHRQQQQQQQQGHQNITTSASSSTSGWRLLQALVRTYPGTFIAVSVFQLITSLCGFGVPLSLKFLVDFIGNYSTSTTIPATAYVAAAVLFLCPALAALANVQQYKSARRLIFRCRAALVGLVFRQTLRVDGAVSTYSSGQVINLCTVDAGNCDAIRYLPFLWAVPLEVSISIALIFWVLRCWISGLVGVVLVVLSVFLTVKLSERLRQAQRALMKRKDARLSLLGEGLQGIRVLKLLAWERDFLGKLEETRASELAALRTFILTQCLISILWTSAPVLVSALTFLLHTLVLQRPLSASQGYATLALFGLLRDPLSSLNTYLNSYVKGQVSLGRLEKFLLEAPLMQKYEGRLLTDDDDEEEEDAGEEKERKEDGEKGSLHVSNLSSLRPGEVLLGGNVDDDGASFAWGDSAQDGRGGLLLSGVRLHAQKGQLVCIYGPTGSGKSSLLMALLGEMRHVSSSASEKILGASSSSSLVRCCGGRVSYAAQRPWLFNGTIRANILFGEPLDQARYEAALEACALRPDLEALEGGDLTEIGEKGVTLSGGQQQRLSLCRAIYHPSDIVLLDDVLSAVDAHVAQHLVRACLTGPLLQGRTRILVTHQVALTLPIADHALILGLDGRIVAQGNPKEDPSVMKKLGQVGVAVDGRAVNAEGEQKDEVKKECKNEESVAETKKPTSLVGSIPSATLLTAKGHGTQLVKAEQKAEGRVKWRVYLAYVQAAGGFALAVPALLTFAGVQALYYFQNKALGDWVVQLEEDGQAHHSADGVYPYVYFSVANIAVVVLQALLTSGGSLLASRRIHQDMGRRVLRAPMAWFERTPLGRVQNRFSSDMDTIDVDVMDTLTKFLSRLAAVLTITAVILRNMAPLVLGMLPVFLLSFHVGYTYQRSARELKRLDSVTRSPIYSHFSETVSGVATLRAYRAQRRFVAESDKRVDVNDKVYHHLWSSNRWLAVRLQLLGAAVVGMVGLYLLVTLGSVAGQTAGLVLLFSSNFSENMNTLIRMQATLEMDVNSIERNAIEYTQDLEQEQPAVISTCRPPSTAWPAQGELKVSHLRLRYPGTETDVLQDVSFHIPPKTKVGVVGRTGAGKTSLVAALFRLVEPSPGSAVSIDGQDILKLGLADLRGRLAIVPQDSILFRGSVRSNLDPFLEFDDEALWAALGKAQLKGRVVQSLDDNVTEGGGNFSVGERALLCMSRALLRKRGVLVLDEATASVDPEADAAMQEMIRTELSDCTVLAVAHRLRTVVYYDLVLVLQQGKVVEFGSPLKLLERTGSAFRALAEQTGEFELLLGMARGEGNGEQEGRKRGESAGDITAN